MYSEQIDVNKFIYEKMSKAAQKARTIRVSDGILARIERYNNVVISYASPYLQTINTFIMVAKSFLDYWMFSGNMLYTTTVTGTLQFFTTYVPVITFTFMSTVLTLTMAVPRTITAIKSYLAIRQLSEQLDKFLEIGQDQSRERMVKILDNLNKLRSEEGRQYAENIEQDIEQVISEIDPNAAMSHNNEKNVSLLKKWNCNPKLYNKVCTEVFARHYKAIQITFHEEKVILYEVEKYKKFIFYNKFLSRHKRNLKHSFIRAFFSYTTAIACVAVAMCATNPLVILTVWSINLTIDLTVNYYLKKTFPGMSYFQNWKNKRTKAIKGKKIKESFMKYERELKEKFSNNVETFDRIKSVLYLCMEGSAVEVGENLQIKCNEWDVWITFPKKIAQWCERNLSDKTVCEELITMFCPEILPEYRAINKSRNCKNIVETPQIGPSRFSTEHAETKRKLNNQRLVQGRSREMRRENFIALYEDIQYHNLATYYIGEKKSSESVYAQIRTLMQYIGNFDEKSIKERVERYKKNFDEKTMQKEIMDFKKTMCNGVVNEEEKLKLYKSYIEMRIKKKSDTEGFLDEKKSLGDLWRQYMEIKTRKKLQKEYVKLESGFAQP